MSTTKKAKDGDLRIVYIRNSNQTTYAVKTVDDAKGFINVMAEHDLADDSVDVNSFSLQIYAPLTATAYSDGWAEWTDDDGNDINGYPI